MSDDKTGLWYASNAQGEWGVYDDDTGCCLLSENHGFDDGFDPEAIAKLAAAAPKLLAAAQVAFETLAPRKNDDFVWAAMSQLLNAIVEATGKVSS